MKIILNEYGFGKYEFSTPITISEDLQITIQDKPKKDGDYIAVVSCNGKRMQEKINDGITIPKDFLSAGRLNIVISYYLNGEKLHEWVVEPLRLKGSSIGLSADTEIFALSNKIDWHKRKNEENLIELKEKLHEQSEKLERVNFAIQILTEKEHKERVAVIKYEYRDYVTSLNYEGTADFVTWAEKVGHDIYDLSEFEIAEIIEFTEEVL